MNKQYGHEFKVKFEELPTLQQVRAKSEELLAFLQSLGISVIHTDAWENSTKRQDVRCLRVRWWQYGNSSEIWDKVWDMALQFSLQCSRYRRNHMLIKNWSAGHPLQNDTNNRIPGQEFAVMLFYRSSSQGQHQNSY